MATEIDRLEIQVQTQAQKANAELDKLVNRLEKVSGSLDRINASGIQGLANGIERLSKSMQGINAIKTTDFSRLARNINKLGSVDQAKINSTASSILRISKSLDSAGGLSRGAGQLTELAKGISRLGYKSATNAITNIPLMAKALQDLMRTLSTSPRVSKNLIDMTNALANLASNGAKVRSAANGINKSFNTYSKTTDRAAKSTRSFASTIGLLYAKFWALKRALQFVWGSVEKSMDFVETINLFETSFKKIGMDASQDLGMDWGSEAANEFAKKFIVRAQEFNDKLTGSLSLDPDLFMNYQAIFAQMSNSMGLVSESAMNISESFTMLGSDIASLWNLEFDVAMKKLQSGLAGQIRPLRDLGIDISKTSLQMYALNYGITDSIENMSQAAKVQLRWLAIMEQAEVSFGDIAKTINAPANQLRILQQQWKNLSRSIGSVFMPTVARVIPYINAVVIALRRMIDALAKLLGFELPDYSDDNIYKDALGDIEGLGDPYEEIVDGADKATKANEKLRKSVQGFDELNILRNPVSSSTGGSGKGGFPSGSGYDILDEAIARKTESYMAKFNKELSNMSNFAEGLADNIEKFFKSIVREAQPTIDAFGRLKKALDPFKDFVFDNLKIFYKEFLVPVGKWVLGEGLPRLLDVLTNLVKDINWTRLTDAFQALWKALSPFAISVGRGLISFIETLGKILKPVLEAAINALASGLEILAKAIDAIPVPMAEAVGGAIGGIVVALATYKTVQGVSKTIENIGKAFKTKFAVFKGNTALQVASIIMAIAGALIAYSEATFAETNTGKLLKELEDTRREIDKNIESTQTLIQTSRDRREDAEFEGEATKELADKYFELADKKSRTVDEDNLLLYYAEQLTKKIPDLNEVIDKQTGAYIGTKDAIYDTIDAYTEYIKVQAAEEMLLDLYKQRFKLERDLKQAQTDRGILEEELFDASSRMAQEEGKLSRLIPWRTAQKERDKIRQDIKAQDLLLQDLEETYNSLGLEIDDTTRIIANQGIKTNTAASEAEKAARRAHKSYQDYKKGVESNPTNIKVDSNVEEETRHMKNEVNRTKLPNKKINVSSDVGSALNSIYTRVRNFKLPTMNVTIGANTSALEAARRGIRGYATGGFPNTGEMFMARENGIPEMVGRIGSRTAVANNDQITDGIASAVEGAMVNALLPVLASGGNSGSGEVLVENNTYIDTELLYRMTEKGKKKSEHRFQTNTVLNN